MPLPAPSAKDAHSKGEGPRARGDARNGASPTSYSGKGWSGRRPSCVRCFVLLPAPAVTTETAGVCDAPDPRTRSRTDPGRRFWPRGRVPPPNRLRRPATCHGFGGYRALGRRRASALRGQPHVTFYRISTSSSHVWYKYFESSFDVIEKRLADFRQSVVRTRDRGKGSEAFYCPYRYFYRVPVFER
jgi:hypothetical protein